MTIKNAKDYKLSQNSNAMPDVSSAIIGWFEPIRFLKITKFDVDGTISEVKTPVTGNGVIQPLSLQELAIKPEGQRSWKWLQIHTDASIVLTTDDVLEIDGENYRVMALFDYSRNGYREYHCGQDYKAS